MNSDTKLIKYLGLAYLIQFVGSLLSGILSDTAIGSGSMSENLVSISNNVLLMRTSIIAELVTVLGIIVMTVLLYVVLQDQNKTYALVALTFWLTEAIFLAVSSVGTNALIPLSLEYVQAGSPEPSYLLTLGSLFYEFKELSYAIHMMFFGLGGIFWYYIFYKSKYIPRALSLWALIMMPFMSIDVLLVLLGIGLDVIWRWVVLAPLIAYLPFEGILGLWFIVKGISDNDSSK